MQQCKSIILDFFIKIIFLYAFVTFDYSVVCDPYQETACASSAEVAVLNIVLVDVQDWLLVAVSGR